MDKTSLKNRFPIFVFLLWTISCSAFGFYIDKEASTFPIFLIIGLIVGIVAGLLFYKKVFSEISK